jgi:hypothetical protein
MHAGHMKLAQVVFPSTLDWSDSDPDEMRRERAENEVEEGTRR